MHKFLFSDEFIHMSNDSKVLYALLRDRHELSNANGWVNDNGEVYLIYTRQEMSEMLGKSLPTVRKAVNELKENGLMEEVQQGLNRANLIYIMDANPITTRSEKFFQSGVKESFSQEGKEFSPNDTDVKKTYKNDTERDNNFSLTSKVVLFLEAFKNYFGYEHRNILSQPDETYLEGFSVDELEEIFVEYFDKYSVGNKSTDKEKCSIENVFASMARIACGLDW
jgi:biotin operon repressor